MKKMTVKKLIGSGVKIIIVAVVAAFLGMRSLDFFNFVTPSEQSYYAWLGFGLTGGGLVAYLLIFMWDADTPLKKTVAIVMLAICTLGELLTAGYGLQIDAWRKANYVLTETDFTSMVRMVQLLAFAHAAAMIAYMAGDKLAEAFGDHDGDGIPNFRDSDYKRHQKPQERPQAPQRTPTASYAQEDELPTLDGRPNEKGGK